MVGAGDPVVPGAGPGLVGPTNGPREEPPDGGFFEITGPFPYKPRRGK